LKQLTVLCSSDISDIVQTALVRAGVEGFLNVPRATGVKPGAAAPHGRTAQWAADLFVAPVPDDLVPRVVQALETYRGSCEEEPCLRILVAPLEAAY
jgi:hypothetical protein